MGSLGGAAVRSGIWLFHLSSANLRSGFVAGSLSSQPEDGGPMKMGRLNPRLGLFLPGFCTGFPGAHPATPCCPGCNWARAPCQGPQDERDWPTVVGRSGPPKQSGGPLESRAASSEAALLRLHPGSVLPPPYSSLHRMWHHTFQVHIT